MKKFLLLLFTPLCVKSQDSLVYTLVKDSRLIVNVYQPDLRDKASAYAKVREKELPVVKHIGHSVNILQRDYLDVLHDSLNLAIREVISADRLEEIKHDSHVFIEFIGNGKGEILQLRFLTKEDTKLRARDFLLLDSSLKVHQIIKVEETYKDYELLPPIFVELFWWKGKYDKAIKALSRTNK